MKIKMLFIYIYCLILFVNNYTFAQCDKTKKDTSYVVELKEFYSGKGIVFGKDEPYYGYGAQTNQRISITKSDVIAAELILDSLINLHFNNDIKKRNQIKTKLRGYYRQYFGLKSESNDKIIVISIFNFNDPKSIEFFKGWDKGFFFSTVDFFNKNARIYWINLTKRKLEDGSWTLELEDTHSE